MSSGRQEKPLWPRWAPEELEGGTNSIVCPATATTHSSVPSRLHGPRLERAPHHPPRPLEGRFCARVVSWDPLCASAGHPPGVDASSPPPPRRNLEIGYNAQDRGADATVGQPTAPHPNIAVWSPGTTPWGQKARRSLLTPRPVHPGWTFVFRSCQCLTSGVLAQGGEKGGFKLGTGRNLFFGLVAPPSPHRP